MTDQASEHKKKRRFFTLKNKRHMPTWLAGILAFFVKLISLTYRVKVVDKEGWYEQQDAWPVVVSLWHNRILFIACLVRRSLLERMSVLISASRDGEYVSAFIRFFGLGVVRGSSSRGGVHALLELNHEIKDERSVILTVDGPRGPKYTVHPGAVILAQKNGLAIIPVSVNAKHYWQAKSWDNTQIPVPFSTVSLVFGSPFSIPKEMSLEDAQQLIHDKMMEITED
ncbi:MAG: lysophospholipid acyltransferase family protein [Victivallales bacterium]|nr:lysophospholipid acyltransferase family protein [Victivallales bacterium]